MVSTEGGEHLSRFRRSAQKDRICQQSPTCDNGAGARRVGEFRFDARNEEVDVTAFSVAAVEAGCVQPIGAAKQLAEHERLVEVQIAFAGVEVEESRCEILPERLNLELIGSL